MKNIHLPKLIAVSLLCIVLAGALAVQAVSGISTRNAPDQAIGLVSANGLAQEQRAFRLFQQLVSDGEDLNEAAKKAASVARKGLAFDPLAPKSHALLAIAENDPKQRGAILEYANQLNRRDISLQAMVLEEHLQANDYRRTITTLDQMLRVHEDYYDDFFPVLLSALKVEEAIPLFPDILNAQATWHEKFLFFAARDDDGQKSLASIRSDLEIENWFFDRDLIKGLAQQGEIKQARSLYDRALAKGISKNDGPRTAWSSDFPPFDWWLSTERDFRSQPDRAGEMLEMYARSGKGGIIAKKVVAVPDGPFEIRTNLEMRASGRSDAVRLLVRCANARDPFKDEGLKPGENAVIVNDPPSNCDYMQVEIISRSLRGEPTLRAELSALVIDAL